MTLSLRLVCMIRFAEYARGFWVISLCGETVGVFSVMVGSDDA